VGFWFLVFLGFFCWWKGREITGKSHQFIPPDQSVTDRGEGWGGFFGEMHFKGDDPYQRSTGGTYLKREVKKSGLSRKTTKRLGGEVRSIYENRGPPHDNEGEKEYV